MPKKSKLGKKLKKQLIHNFRKQNANPSKTINQKEQNLSIFDMLKPEKIKTKNNQIEGCFLSSWFNHYFALFIDYFFPQLPKEIIKIIFQYLYHLGYQHCFPNDFLESQNCEVMSSWSAHNYVPNLGRDSHHQSLLLHAKNVLVQIVFDENQQTHEDSFSRFEGLNEKIFISQELIFKYREEVPVFFGHYIQEQSKTSPSVLA